MALHRSRRGRDLPPAKVLSLDSIKYTNRGRQKGCDNSHLVGVSQGRPSKRKLLPHQGFQQGNSGFRATPTAIAAREQQAREQLEERRMVEGSQHHLELARDHAQQASKLARLQASACCP